MKKVILCNPPYDRNWVIGSQSNNLPPVGIMLLATILAKRGLEVEMINGAIERDWREKTLAGIDARTAFVGMSVMSTQATLALELAAEIKRRTPSMPVVWGGFHCAIFPEQTAENANIDIVVRGEADLTIVQILEHLEGKIGKSEIGGITYKDDSGRIVSTPYNPLSGFDTLPQIDYSLVKAEALELTPVPLRNEVYRLFPLLTGLGCNYKCAFCHNAIFNKHHRSKTAPEIIREMKFYRDAYGVTAFSLYDEDFFSNKNRVLEFLGLIEKERLPFKWFANLKANYVSPKYLDDAFFARLSRCGCLWLGIGAESGSQRILNFLNKKTTVEQNLVATETIAKSGINLVLSFITFLPTETRDELMETITFILKIMKRFPEVGIIGPQCFRPYPGSTIYNIALQYGIDEPKTLEDWKDYDEIFSHFTKINFEKMPWVAKEDREYMKIRLQALFVQNLGKGYRGTLKKKLLGVALDLFKRIQLRRLEANNFSFYIEKPVMEFMDRKFFT